MPTRPGPLASMPSAIVVAACAVVAVSGAVAAARPLAAPPPADAGVAEAPRVAPAPPGTSLRRIQEEGVLRWGADPSGGAPFALPDPNDPRRIIGFEVELVDALAARLGVRAELVAGDWLALIDNMRAGRIDLVLNGLEVTAERREVVDFTEPYYSYAQQLAVREADRGKYRSLEDLRGRRVSSLNGAAAVDVLKEAGFDDDQIAQYDDSLTPYLELASGRVDGSLAESIIAGYYAANVPGLHLVPETFSPGVYGGAVRKGEPALLAALDDALRAMKRDGTLGRIYQRWGVWDDGLAAIGVEKGAETARIPEASGDSAKGIDWAGVLRELLRGTGFTLLITATSFPLAVVAGLGLALAARSRRAWLRGAAGAYVQAVRGTPLLVQIFLVYYTLPVLGERLGIGHALVLPALFVGILCLAGNYAAYEAEVHRAGLQAVPKGQREAALSLGMTEGQAFRHVVLPQSFRIILPPLLNDLVSMIKDTSLVYVIGVRELTAVALGIGKSRFMVPQMLVLAALFYLVVSVVADIAGRRLEASLRRRGAGGAMHANAEGSR